ncbi:MAG: hypothetical protein AVDCRST_MAG27-3122 [uncultured Craurococcus sp.]|uniref:Uncharacterized protein n=1 Tax=uncultured Craurococcus sp. TaxID=1135998 RepID=A0A6J4J752_9PROT|nr:MAG: hypothetical protein AVDCRST_MAG27-3122 [uncultured Craurococcus sp.]
MPQRERAGEGLFRIGGAGEVGGLKAASGQASRIAGGLGKIRRIEGLRRVPRTGLNVSPRTSQASGHCSGSGAPPGAVCVRPGSRTPP